jgi:hypothetical protein
LCGQLRFYTEVWSEASGRAGARGRWAGASLDGISVDRATFDRLRGNDLRLEQALRYCGSASTTTETTPFGCLYLRLDAQLARHLADALGSRDVRTS